MTSLKISGAVNGIDFECPQCQMQHELRVLHQPETLEPAATYLTRPNASILVVDSMHQVPWPFQIATCNCGKPYFYSCQYNLDDVTHAYATQRQRTIQRLDRRVNWVAGLLCVPYMIVIYFMLLG